MDENKLAYQMKVMDELESFDYPSMVVEFYPEDVARSICKTVDIFFRGGESFRICAITIWSLTLNYQIIPLVNSGTKH